MYVQVVTYGLAGISEREYLDVANDLAPRFSAMSGLLAKLWVGNTEEGRYGAVYFWEDREAMERFVDSDLFEETNPEFAEVVSEHFDIHRNLTAATQPVIELIDARGAPSAKPVGTGPAKKAVGGKKAARTVPSAGARKTPATTKSAAQKARTTKKASKVGKATKKAAKTTKRSR